MKKFMSKNTIQKIVIAIIIVLSFNFIMPSYSQADWGGVLMGPVIDLFAGLGDAVLSALQYFFYNGNVSVLNAGSGAAGSAANIVLSSLPASPVDSNFLLDKEEANFIDKLKQNESYVDINTTQPQVIINSADLDKGWFGQKSYGIPIIRYTPEAIFSNQVPALDANFINPKDATDYAHDAQYYKDLGFSDAEAQELAEQSLKNAEALNSHSVTIALRSTIANWYIALRNLAIVILLSVLVYVGIRIVIASTAADKSKYKQMLMDWVVALCIVFFLHYIMSFILSLTEIITDGLATGTQVIVKIEDPDGDFGIRTNLTGLCRLQLQDADLGTRFIYLLFYLALAIYSVIFTWKYMKRVITMAFFTLMAPLVAITYPMDKISDGKAQAFGIWLKEFVFNALLQPFHLILYSIFLGAGMEIAIANPIYAILFLAFMTPAEKLLRKMFGFDKASTTDAVSAAGMLGGAALIKSAGGFLSKMGKSGSGKSNIRTKDGGGSSSGGSAPSVSDSFGNGAPLPPGGSSGGATTNSTGRTASTSGGYGGGTSTSTSGYGGDGSSYSLDTGSGQYSNGYGVDGYSGDYSLDTGEGAGGYSFSSGDYGTTDTGMSGATSYTMGDASQRQSLATQTRMRNLQRGGKTWTPDDTRGMGQWLGDNARNAWNNSELKGKLEGSKAARAIRKIGGTAKSVRDMAVGQYERLPKPVRNTLRGAVGTIGKGALGLAKTGAKVGAGIAIGGTLGLAAGITGDSLEDVLKGAAAGAAIGVAGTSIVGHGIANAARGVRNTYEQQAFGRVESSRRQAEREWKSSDNANIEMEKYLTKELGRTPTSRELKEGMNAGADYYSSGIQEPKDVTKAMSLEKEIQSQLASSGINEEEANERARNQAKTIAKWAKGVKDEDLRDEGKTAKIRNSVTNELIQKGSLEKANAQAQADHFIQLLKRYKGVY